MKAGGQGQRFGVLVNRLFGLREKYLSIDVAPETLSTFELTSERFEYLFPRGEVPWRIRMSRVADVANFSVVAIVNPPGSGICIVVETTENEAPLQSLFFNVRRNNALGPPTAPAFVYDARSKFAVAGIIGFTGIEAAAPGDSVVTIGQGVVKPTPAVLPPNSMAVLEGLAINTAVPALDIAGYLRQCKPDEMEL